MSCEPPSVARSTDSDRNPPLIFDILVSSVCGVGWREVSVPPIITTADYSPDAATLRVFASQPRVGRQKRGSRSSYTGYDGGRDEEEDLLF